VLGSPPPEEVGLFRDTGAEDEGEPGVLDRVLVRFGVIPASATAVTSVSWCAAMNEVMTGSMVLVSALLPSNAWTISGNPEASVSNPTVICGSRRRSSESPGSRNPSPASVTMAVKPRK
jgi:hypothetical protein